MKRKSAHKPATGGSLCGAPTRGGGRCRRRVPAGEQHCRWHRPADAGPVTAAIAVGEAGYRKRELLASVLDAGGLWERVEMVRAACGVSRRGLRIVIKPDLECYDVGSPGGTDPELVELLIELLHARGYAQVAVVSALGSSDLWLENREVAVLAELLGYRYRTEAGRPYEVVDLSEEVVAGDFPTGSVLAGSDLGRAWREAHFRLSVAKNKTQAEDHYALGVHNLLGVLPLRDKEYHYHHRLDGGDVSVALLQRTPVHFSVIDALVSSHAGGGLGGMQALATDTLIASADVVLTDWVGALKMGLDPYVSRLNAAVLRQIGLPRRYRITGDLQPYGGWQNVPRIVSQSVRRRNRSVAMQQLVRPWLQPVNEELFPFKNSVDVQVNRALGGALSGSEEHPLAQAAMVGINYLLGSFQSVVEGYEILYGKDRVRRQVRSVGLEVERYGLEAYEAIVEYIEPLADIASRTPMDGNGLRWRYVDGSVLFEYRRRLPVSYEGFVKRVAISAAVRMMNDNIGGACVVVGRDGKGRITHQVERNVYLPQPNWMVLFGGQVIDVGKLEYVRYGKDQQQIFWRTVASENESAQYDDGVVTFARAPGGETEVRIVARQQFTLPWLWQGLDLDLMPAVKDALVSDAYTTFFTRTVTNYEAASEGREVGTGRSWAQGMGEPGQEGERPPLAELAAGLIKLLGSLAPVVNLLRRSAEHFSADDAERGGAREVPWAQLLPADLGERLLRHLLALMSLWLSQSQDYRRNIEDFNARYVFRTREPGGAVTATFAEEKLRVENRDSDEADTIVTFKSAQTMMDLLLSPAPDILRAMLRQDIQLDGNLNYLLKFAHLARELWDQATGGGAGRHGPAAAHH